ncbi:MAG: bifunctional 23S rRNA (guanine(2069)-N(7))-methyltransferase RlmK/23S rRNA (guanine(2445)-N(2))-methyltransferase RlmL [Gammaproteobacteria bacterium]
MNVSCFATAPKGLETLLADELRSLGAIDVREARAGVAFSGPLSVAYRACLWSRLASRILLKLDEFRASDPDALYAGAAAIRWEAHLSPAGSFAVDFNTAGSAITHTHFGALKVKDAVVDRFRERFGVRPSVRLERPEVRVNVHLSNNEAVVSIDLAGESLHRRGYREEQVEAPLKENLAAAILLRAGWPQLAARGAPLVDPMCGSGTLPIEAALMAGDIAPGLARDYYGFHGWRQHDARAWSALLEEARARRQAGLQQLPPVRGCDEDPRAVALAMRNVARAGLEGHVEIKQRALGDGDQKYAVTPGLVVMNPPYGERLGDSASLPARYRALGLALKRNFAGWQAAVFTGNPACGRHLGLRAHKVHKLFNGALPCELLHIALHAAASAAGSARSESAAGFANRLRKNARNLKRWRERENVACYRLYDADLPDYNLAIDLYQNDALCAHVQEYEAPPSVDLRRARARLNEVLAVIPEILDISPARVYLKRRRRQRDGAQYQKLGTRGAYHAVREGECRLYVNFTDYLDTGLFLDHRITRSMLGALAAGRRFLNLFAYTGAATVHAARGGAVASVSVDMSRTYLDWARRNFELNGIDTSRHSLVRAEVRKWLSEDSGRRFELIFIDPPSFSRSRRMTDTFDIQRDHADLIRAAAALLAPGGIIIFSTNMRRFRMSPEALGGLAVEDISRQTLPKDFARNPRIHQCFRITRGS